MGSEHQDSHGDGAGRGVQDRLIDAAEDLFCWRGFNETSVRDIAAAADCNVASVNYYFGGKENLYVEIWRRRLAQIRDLRLASIETVMSAGQPGLEELLRAHAISFLEPLIEGGRQCRFIKLMAREMIDPRLPRNLFLAEMVIPVVSAMSRALMEICPGLNEADANVLILLLAGQLVHTVCAKEMFEESGLPGLFQVNIEGLVDHIVRFSAAGIRAYASENGD
ncbi:MAG: TetR/AcrR family transcriptional regulator [Phycisphaerae bacterium]|nr:TetR/AcrR family transcriptional regulator [Phycisphaerae bacterium]